MLFLLLKSDRLVLFSPKGQQEILLPAQAMKYQEIRDKQALETVLTETFAHQKHEVGIFLDEDVTYQKVVAKTTANKMDEEVGKFFDSLPFPVTSLAKVIVYGNKEYICIATNKIVAETFTTFFTQKGWKVSYVVPVSMFATLRQNRPISFGFLKAADGKKDILDKVNFLTHSYKEPEEEKGPEQKVPVGQILALIASLTFLFSIIGYGLFSSGILHIGPKKQALLGPTPTPIVQVKPTIVPTATPSAVSKQDLRIQILNGSGIVGQAGKVKDQLSSLGYTNVQTGNAQGANSATTIVIFSSSVSAQFQTDIVGSLKTTFTTVDSQQVPSLDNFDVSITTGQGVK